MPETTIGCDKDKLKVMTHVIREIISTGLRKKKKKPLRLIYDLSFMIILSRHTCQLNSITILLKRLGVE
jgi:hypothetical protein